MKCMRLTHESHFLILGVAHYLIRSQFSTCLDLDEKKVRTGPHGFYGFLLAFFLGYGCIDVRNENECAKKNAFLSGRFLRG